MAQALPDADYVRFLITLFSLRSLLLSFRTCLSIMLLSGQKFGNYVPWQGGENGHIGRHGTYFPAPQPCPGSKAGHERDP